MTLKMENWREKGGTCVFDPQRTKNSKYLRILKRIPFARPSFQQLANLWPILSSSSLPFLRFLICIKRTKHQWPKIMIRIGHSQIQIVPISPLQIGMCIQGRRDPSWSFFSPLLPHPLILFILLPPHPFIPLFLPHPSLSSPPLYNIRSLSLSSALFLPPNAIVTNHLRCPREWDNWTIVFGHWMKG